MRGGARRPRICVIGSYVHVFTIEVPHAPEDGESVIGGRSQDGPGGKGSNQAIQMARLGAEVDLVAAVGDDERGRDARRLWEGEGIRTRQVRGHGTLPTGLAFITVDASGQNRIAVDVGANAALDAAAIEDARAEIAAADLVVAQFETPVAAVRTAFLIARETGTPTLLNPAPPRPAGGDLLALVDVLTPNRIEATALAGLDPGAEPATAARALRERGAGTVVVTLEAEGALCLHGEEARRLPGLAVPVRDTTGAGDAFTGALAVGLAS
ncbi:MAG: ribokinase, partial [Candidatus Dormiibacterota bacterium]